MVTLFAFILALLWVGSVFAFLGAYFVSEFAVRGTHRAYVSRGIRRLTQWPALSYSIVFGAVAIHNGDWMMVLHAYNAVWISLSIRKFYRDDEDDFWKRGKKKLKKVARKLARRARELKPSIVRPATAGAAA